MKVRRLTVGSIYRNEQQVPMIRLTGLWLNKSGFEIGKKVNIQESYGELNIQLVADPGEEE